MTRWIPGLLFASVLVGQIRMPSYQRAQFENGAVVYVMPKKDLPLASVRVILKGGLSADPVGMEGLAAVTTSLLLRGTALRSREQLAQDLDQMGITINAVAGNSGVALEMQYLSGNLGAAMKILEEVLMQPAFAEAELKRLVAQQVDAVKVAKEQPQMALRNYLNAFYFGKQHPYGRQPNGDDVSLPKITREAVDRYWKQAFVGKRLMVVVAGDVEAKPAEASIRTAFEKLPAGTAFAMPKAATPKRGEPRLLLVDLPGATQTYFAIAQPGIDRTSADRTRLELVNALFGGRFTSMLNDALRVDSGLTYGALSTVQMDQFPGMIAITTFTKTESTEAAVDLVLKQLEKLQTKGIDAEQLASAKAYVKGEYPTRKLETVDQLAAVLVDFELYGLNRGEVDDLISRMDAVTIEEANKVARDFYQTGGLVFVWIGDASKVRKTAKKYAKDIRVIKNSEPGY